MHLIPSRAAQAAVSMAWLDWAPPVVNTVSHPCSSASASRNSSLRTLLPPRATPHISSRMIQMFFPYVSLMRSSL